jgi:hypothetical protein
MFAELFRIVARYRLEVPPEFAAVFRALSTLEGGLTALSPGFDIVAEAERFGRAQLGQLAGPDALRTALSEEAMALLPILRRLPRRFDRITAAVEGGRLNVNVRLLADERDRSTVTGWLHQLMITVLAATAGLMAVVLLSIKGGPVMTRTVSLYQFLGYCLLVICSLLALRVLARVFRAELTALEDAPDEHHRARVLQAVGDDADQPHAQRDRWVPALVHDPGQVIAVHAADQVEGLLVDRVMVRREQLAAGSHACDLLRRVAVTGRVAGHPEPVAPLRPHLLDPERARHVVVLHPGQVPGQPGDRVGVGVQPHLQLVLGQSVDGPVQVLAHPAERIRQQLSNSSHKANPIGRRRVG